MWGQGRDLKWGWPRGVLEFTGTGSAVQLLKHQLEINTLGVFTPQKAANATNQGFSFFQRAGLSTNTPLVSALSPSFPT